MSNLPSSVLSAPSPAVVDAHTAPQLTPTKDGTQAIPAPSLVGADHRLAANTIRTLAIDAVQKANSGHPGMPMGMADVAVVLWTQFLRYNPADPHWPNRDRFVLSGGHGSMLLYALLHLTGYDLPLAQLQAFRQWGSLTPGHPEHDLTPGVETTTGPLGQGLANAVGMALAERWLAHRFNQPDFPLVEHYTYVMAGDGDLMEGVAHEACALAGHWGLGKLILLYDNNGISIDGPTTLSFTEDVLARFTAYGWQVEAVDGHEPVAIADALRRAQADTDRPSLIACRTHIGYGSPNRQDTAKAHGEPLGEAEVRLTKANLGWPSEEPFFVPAEVYAFLRASATQGAQQQQAWTHLLTAYTSAYPEQAAAFQQALAGELPADWSSWLPTFAVDKPLATRAASGQILDAIAPRIPTVLGGSADLTPSNNTLPKGAVAYTRHAGNGHYVHFGVREHGMGSILNGLALHGGVRPYGGTFLVFSDYMRPALRMAALMGQPVIFVFTHDSIGLGEDGPTHQPIEHLLSLRAIPNLYVFRPADATETVEAWRVALTRRDGPTALILTRQALPVLDRTRYAPAILASRGAYVLADARDPHVLLLATGSEVQLALAAQQRLAEQHIRARVVSMPCQALFDAQPAGYRASVLPPTLRARVAIEAGSTLGWGQYVGLDGVVIGLDRFGASAPYQTLYRELGLTVDAVVAAALAVVRD